MKKIRVVLADDNAALVAAVRETLDEEFEVVAAVENGSQAVDAVLELDPDVLIMDISMPVLDGLKASAALHAAGCRTKILVLSTHEAREFVAAALYAGASGYVIKRCLFSDLMPTIREALSGHKFVSLTTKM